MEMIVYRKGVPYTCYYDEEDAALVAGYLWSIVKGKRDRTMYLTTSRQQGGLYFHKLVLGFPKTQIDHRNGNGLDNRKANLRPATGSQNCSNRGKRNEVCTSKYKGVCLKQGKSTWDVRWVAQINGQYLGSFTTEIAAAQAYNAAALTLHGDFAVFNHIGG
jgi:hypothetical protein